MDEVDPIYPNKSVIDALHHLFKSATIDSGRILQQTVCYDRWFSWTISVSWGYAIEVFNQHLYLHDVLRVQDTFSQWKKGAAGNYLFSTRFIHPDRCRGSTIFFLDEVHEKRTIATSKYKIVLPENCTYDPMTSPKKLKDITIFSRYLSIKQVKAHL